MLFAWKLTVQLLELIFVEPELLPAGFERSQAAEPVVGVFDIGGIHVVPCLVLVGYTAIEACNVGEGEATSCSERLLSAIRSRSRATVFDP